jgi:hypothetical protein
VCLASCHSMLTAGTLNPMGPAAVPGPRLRETGNPAWMAIVRSRFTDDMWDVRNRHRFPGRHDNVDRYAEEAKWPV